MRILGIDYGKKRIGFAVGSTDEKIAFPRDVVEGIDRAIPFIEDIDNAMDEPAEYFNSAIFSYKLLGESRIS